MRSRFLLLAALCGGLALSQPAAAEKRGLLGLPQTELRDNRLREPARGLSPSDAARRAQQQNGGGRVLGVEPAGNGYRVKLLKDGEVRVVYVSE